MQPPVGVLKLQPLLLRLKPAWGQAACFWLLLPAILLLLLLHGCCSQCFRGSDRGCRVMLEEGIVYCMQIHAGAHWLAFVAHI
jgi:hypothetical protein